MDVLIVDTVDADVLGWLGSRHELHVAPQLAADAFALRAALETVRALVIPPGVALDAATLRDAPRLKVVGRVNAAAENIDLDACVRAGIEVVRPAAAHAAAEAEFVVGALLQLLRRVPIINAEGLHVGRELGGAVVGLVGITPSFKPLARLLTAFGATVKGYDPGVHASDGLWSRVDVEPSGLQALVRGSDALCLLLTCHTRYHGLFGERLLTEAKMNQVVVSLSHARLFDEVALAHALTEGPLAAAWLDAVEPDLLAPGRPLHGVTTLQTTPRVAASTHESRIRGAWAVARRIDEVLLAAPRGDFRTTRPAALAGLAIGPTPA
ncbi:Phosphoglycerate dehydrogenase [Rubrivivax sp. A210]|uniref:NAD(P)-dependent oxidoreductase n=1 Tax=Rubrivivax sp. A210 TaxID=2772301 RepID=UPI00191B406E|nr:NAD(P)-dependent oxidoreductase [Rubrivivax sp. A210]CAD5373772.1 Phosphoglycerate dehydrogenase [Rubrivivax sp. A210]